MSSLAAVQFTVLKRVSVVADWVPFCASKYGRLHRSLVKKYCDSLAHLIVYVDIMLVRNNLGLKMPICFPKIPRQIYKYFFFKYIFSS